jgi:hypothetical protein
MKQLVVLPLLVAPALLSVGRAIGARFGHKVGARF